ncbi:MAG: hypothetical protein ACKVJU_18390 [Verrucomicrobiales bacterium]
MPLYLPKFGVLISNAILAVGEPPAIPWYQSDKFFLVPLLFCFGAGVLLGFILLLGIVNKRNAKKLIAGPHGEGDNLEATPDEHTAQLREEISADFERSRASLQGEMDAAQSLIYRQKSEIEQRDEKLAQTEAKIEARERRVDELVSLTKTGVDDSGNPNAVAHAQASIIKLSETIKSERLHIDSGITRLEQIEGRITDQKTQVWSGIEDIISLRSSVAEKGGRRARDLATHLQKLEDQMRTHHQNASGCIQQAATARKRLKNRQSRLGNTIEAVNCVEKRMASLDELTGKNLKDELEIAIEELALSKELIAGQKNGIQQEIGELNGRVDWLLNDSSKGFFASLDGLKEAKHPRNKNLREELTTTERKLSKIRSLLTRMADPDSTAPIHAMPTIRRRIEPAFTETISALHSAALAPSISIAPPTESNDVSGLETEVETLKSELNDEKKSAETLRGSLAETQSLVQELESKSPTVAATVVPLLGGSNLMRRLLRLGPGRRETTANSLAECNLDEGWTGPQISTHELKSVTATVDTGPVNGTEYTQEIEGLRQSLTERDSKISKLESEIRQLTAPIPLPSELPDFEENAAEQPIPNVTILPLEPGRFDKDEPETPAASTGFIPAMSLSNGDKQKTTFLVFRGDDPKIWNTKFHDSRGNIAVPLDQLSDSIEFLRLKRLDTGDFIEIPITRDALIQGGSRNENRGWSGKAEHYFGSMHLGIFDEALPHDVETKFGAGGWGFGHRYEIGSGQAYSWEGKEIDPVRFEITVGKFGADNSTNQQGLIDEPTLLDREAVSNEKGAPEGSSSIKGTFDEPTGSVRETESAKLPEEGVVVFRSNDPSLWNRTIYRGTNQRARSLDELEGADQIQWLKLKQCDSGESVLVPITHQQLAQNGDGATCGFNGANELFYGAHHLGVFDSDAKLDIETRFTFGGWGFGHSNSIAADESQACGWAGEKIASDTVFEITVFSELPDAAPNDVVLGGIEN